MALDRYITRDGKQLRCGYTTGSCAALAAKGALRLLLTGAAFSQEQIQTPAGIPVTADIVDPFLGEGFAHCAVLKDAGDDIDATDGLAIVATVSRSDPPGVFIRGGEGVGRVTLPGLEQPVGEAAINRVPRRMIAFEIESLSRELGYGGGAVVEISVPGGEEIAARTFNPRLGIVGGISILGTSGIVEPKSVQALVDTIGAELRVRAAQGHKALILTPGHYGEAFLKEHPPREKLPVVQCSNYVGEAVDLAVAQGFAHILLAGHAGKFVKLAAGVMNTHSRVADARGEVFAAHAALAGADAALAGALLEAPTADACLSLLEQAGLAGPVMATIRDRAMAHLRHRAGPDIELDLVIFSNAWGVLAATAGARALLGLPPDPAAAIP